MINPAVAGLGGFVQLVDAKDQKVYLQMGGGCQGCGAADVTLKQGIERLIREELPEVEEVLDTTDPSAPPYPAPAAHRTDTRCSLGSPAARCGWATCGLPCGPQPDTRNCARHRGEGERPHRDRPVTRAILRRRGLAVTKRAEGCGGGAGGGRRRVAGAASRQGPSCGLREGGGGTGLERARGGVRGHAAVADDL
jgi:Fe-S cluster biogenesis protein NfuA